MCERPTYAGIRRISQENGLTTVHGKKGEPRNDTLDRKRNKTKIPAQVRNNLENALVGLCDVWFEEIKPHLLRHKIKVHCQREVNEDADKNPARRCSHPLLNRMVEGEKYTDPKVYSIYSEPPNSASCEMCRLLVDAAAGIERAASQATGGVIASTARYRHTAPAPAVPATAKKGCIKARSRRQHQVIASDKTLVEPKRQSFTENLFPKQATSWSNNDQLFSQDLLDIIATEAKSRTNSTIYANSDQPPASTIQEVDVRRQLRRTKRDRFQQSQSPWK